MIAFLVEWVTKKPSVLFVSREERDRCYNERFARAPYNVILIKLADRLHNLRTLSSCPREKRDRKIEETYRYFLPLSMKHNILVDEIRSAITYIEKYNVE